MIRMVAFNYQENEMRKRPVILKIPMKLGGRTKFQLEMWALSAAGGIAFSSKSFIGEGWSKVVEASVKPQQGWSMEYSCKRN